MAKKRVLHIIDGKYGKGVEVKAEWNPQLMIYGLMGLDEYNHIHGPFDVVRMHIVQPPLDNISVWEISADDLRKWCDDVLLPGILATRDPDAKFGPSEKACRFCLAKAFCKARADKNLQTAREDFGDTPDARTLTPEQIAELLPQLPEIKRWCDDIAEHAQSIAMAGNPPPGWKIVEGRSNRRWTDEAEVIRRLREEGLDDEEIFTQKLAGITAIEKLVGRRHPVFELAVKPQGAPTLVPVSDDRPEMSFGVESDFSEPVNP